MNILQGKLSLVYVAGGFFIVCFLGLGSYGLVSVMQTWWFTGHALRAPGTVIGTERLRRSLVVDFTFADRAGVVHTQRAAQGSPSKFAFEAGEKVTVLYDPSAPKHSNIDAYETLWAGPIYTTCFGAAGSAFACVWLFLAIRQTRLKEAEEGEPTD